MRTPLRVVIPVLVSLGLFACGSSDPIKSEGLAGSSVTADKLAAKSVTNPKLADAAVDARALAPAAVTSPALAAGAVTTAAILGWAAWKRPLPVLARAAFWTLLVTALPAWVLMRACAEWIASDEGLTGSHQPDWINIGSGVADGGIVLLLVATALAYWWTRSGNAVVGRVVTGLTSIYLAALVLAWLAMSAKWS